MKKLCIIALLLLTGIHSWAGGTDYSQYHYQPTVVFNTWWGVANLVVKVMDKQEVMTDVEVGVFTKGSNPVLRGVAKYSADDGVWWITVHGDEAEAMEFHLWDNSTQQEKIIDQSWVFQPGNFQGSIDKPYYVFWTRQRTLYQNSLRVNACSLKFDDLDSDNTWQLLVNLNNPDDHFSQVSFDLVLPEKLKINYDDSYWLYKGSRTSAQTKKGKQMVDVFKSPEVTQEDGIYHVSLSSALVDSVINGTSGDIIEFYVTPETGLTDGAKTLQIKNVILTRLDDTITEADDYETTLLIEGIDAVTDGKVAVKGELTSEFLDEISKNATILSYDMTEAFIPDGTTFSPANPNALVFVDSEDADKLTDDKNVVCDGHCSELYLTDGYGFYTPLAFTASIATFNRELTGLGTICLPFAPSTDGYEYYELKADNGTTLSFTKVDTPEADKPYLYKKTGTEPLTAIDVNVSDEGADQTQLGETWTMKGTYSSVILTSTDNAYALSDGMIYHNAGTLNMKPFRAYFIHEGSDVKSVNVVIEGETAITYAPATACDDDSALMYNISGQMVDGSYKGMVIRNGIKLIKK